MKLEIQLPIKYRPVVKQLSGDLDITMKKLIELLLVLYIKELNEKYYDDVENDLIK